jgi:hypothetical protein
MLLWKIRAGLVAVTGLGLLSGIGWAQSADSAESQERITNGGVNHTIYADPVVGQPFSAEQAAKQGRTLNDGVNITHFGHHFVARDSAGRMRVEQPCGCDPSHEQKIEVYIVDPVAHTLTTWRVGGNSPKIAMVSKLPERKPQTAEALKLATTVGSGSGRPQPIVTTEELPVTMIDNLPMKVTKTTTIVPAGRSGNDAPITKVHEVWTSEDLKLTFMEQWEDPRTGVRTVALVNFKRAEPDPSLFRVPAGYQVKDAKEMMKEAADKLANSM